MLKESISFFKCVHCNKSNFSLNTIEEDITEIQLGTLCCKDCNFNYKIEKGIVDFVEKNNPSDETKGWEIFSKKENWYNPNEEYLDALPFNKSKELIPTDTITWDRHSRNFFRAISYLDLKNKHVLDLGAGRCWSTKYLSLQGAKCFASDIMKENNIGLETGNYYMKKNNVFFERIRNDMNKLPFMDGSFDIVFASGAIHHSKTLQEAFKECYRVLKKGGILVLANEDSGAYKNKEIYHDVMPGVFEHCYRAYRQYFYIKKCGFKNIKIIPDVYYHDIGTYGYHWASKLSYIHPVFIKFKLLFYGGVFNLITKK